jgi:hypothetical protein
MNKEWRHRAWSVILAAGLVLFTQTVRADMEWRVSPPVDLKVAPLDIAPSPDGQRLFVLAKGEVLVYSLREGKIIGAKNVDQDFDRIAALGAVNGVTLSSSNRKTLQVLTFEMIQNIDISGSPFKGPENAPVTLIVFDDYQ